MALQLSILRLLRDNDDRSWRIDGPVSDLPGGCNWRRIWPIVIEKNNKVVLHWSWGYIDDLEKHAYVVWRMWDRSSDTQLKTVEQLIVTTTGENNGNNGSARRWTAMSPGTRLQNFGNLPKFDQHNLNTVDSTNKSGSK